jgi:putative restriction endonuclease
MQDDDVRSSCFASLDVLSAKHGEDIPYSGGLDQGFRFRGRRVSFLSRYKGIHRAAIQRGPAALSIQTSAESPYDDEELPDGFLYAYRAGSIDQPDNRALRSAFTLAVPIVYFVATRPGWYKAVHPCYVVADDPVAAHVLVLLVG